MTSPAVFGQPIQAQHCQNMTYKTEPRVATQLRFAETYTNNIYSGDWVKFYATLCEGSISQAN